MRLLSLLITLLVPAVATAAGPTCALLDPEKTPRAALLEAKLLAEPGMTWVERADIDKVLKEQKLQAMFSPQGVGERVKLGKLLKADLLVMVRPVKGAEQPTLEVVVSETASGLRLHLRGVPVTKDAGADVAALLAAARDGIRRAGEKVTEVVAVPPFVSQNLEFTHEHLKAAYAKLAEAEALDRKGVLAVELEEAESLAKEIALAAPGAKIERPLPVYLLGEFRHEGRGKDATASVKLRAERGGKPVGKPESAAVKPGEEAAAVRKWSAGVLDALAKDDRPRPPADPKTEAKQLAERARVFKRLGNATETLALIDASLLLDPAQPGLHVDAIKALVPLLESAWRRQDQETLAVLYRRGLAHLEAFYAVGGRAHEYLKERDGVFVIDFMASVNFLGLTGSPPRRTFEVVESLRKDQREAFLRVMPAEAKQGKGLEVMYLSAAVRHLPPREKYEAIEKVIRDLRELPDPANRAVAYALVGHAAPPDIPESRAFLDRLAASDDKALRQAAAQLRELIRTGAGIIPPMGDVAGPGPGGIKLTPIGLSFEARDAAPTHRSPRSLGGIIPVGTGVDVLWSHHAVYVMKEKGKCRLLWGAAAEDNLNFLTVVFDGKYVWACGQRMKHNPVLVVIDPREEKAWDLSTADGLPLAPAKEIAETFAGPPLMGTPLGEGHACLTGSFLGRAWVGVAAFDPATGKAAVKVIHEAKDVPDRTDADQWKSTTVAFMPRDIVTLAGPAAGGAEPGQRVLVGRMTRENADVNLYPLLLDPDRGTAEVLPQRVWVNPLQYRGLVADGALHYVRSSAPNQRGGLVRLGLPEVKPEVIAEGPLAQSPVTGIHLAAHGGQFHVLLEGEAKYPPGADRGKTVPVRQYRWVTVGLDGKNPRLVATGLESLNGVWVSSHYGLVTLVAQGVAKPSILCTVEIGPPKK